ncbi:hypothetical protein [Sporomusa aerivorans]|uniref:hypothetical protein n=1 Tax=Sporomusa aerivorans TaxID=204936 RepID=UPI00352AB105
MTGRRLRGGRYVQAHSGSAHAVYFFIGTVQAERKGGWGRQQPEILALGRPRTGKKPSARPKALRIRQGEGSEALLSG